MALFDSWLRNDERAPSRSWARGRDPLRVRESNSNCQIGDWAARSACLAFLSFSSMAFPLRLIQTVASFTSQTHLHTHTQLLTFAIAFLSRALLVEMLHGVTRCVHACNSTETSVTKLSQLSCYERTILGLLLITRHHFLWRLLLTIWFLRYVFFVQRTCYQNYLTYYGHLIKSRIARTHADTPPSMNRVNE